MWSGRNGWDGCNEAKHVQKIYIGLKGCMWLLEGALG